MLTLVGDTEAALKSLHNYHQVMSSFITIVPLFHILESNLRVIQNMKLFNSCQKLPVPVPKHGTVRLYEYIYRRISTIWAEITYYTSAQGLRLRQTDKFRESFEWELIDRLRLADKVVGEC